MSDYSLQYPGATIDALLGRVNNPDNSPTANSDNLVKSGGVKSYVDGKTGDLSNLITTAKTNLVAAINEVKQSAGGDSVKYSPQTLTEEQKAQARANIGAASLADIEDMDFVTAASLPTASASTMGHIYLIGPDANNNYDRYFTQESGGAYSWVSLGSTQMDLSDYATKAEVTQLEHEVSGNLMSSRAKNALLAVFDKVAFAVPDVSAEMTELENALFNLDEIVGIEATYNQGGTVVYDQGVSTLDELGGGLVVKAVYGDGTKVAISSYTLSGDISTAGTQTITASFLGFTDTFEVEVTHYTAQMVFKISDGDIASYKGTLARYDNNTKYCINDFGTSTNRRVFLAPSGDAVLTNSSGTSIGKYPIPIPRNARKVTVTVTPSATLNIGIATGLLNGTVYEYVTGKSYFTNPSDGGIVQTFSEARFDSYRKGGWYLLVLCTPDSSFSGNEPTESVVTFE